MGILRMRTVSGSFVVLALLAVTASGQMGGRDGMQRENAGTPQTMSHDMMQNMTGVMAQMSSMLQKLSHPMGHMTVTEHARLQEMSKIMHMMAVGMTDLALHLEKGKIDRATAASFQDRMDAINKELEELQARGR